MEKPTSVVYKKAFDAKSRGRSVHNEYGNYGKKKQVKLHIIGKKRLKKSSKIMLFYTISIGVLTKLRS